MGHVTSVSLVPLTKVLLRDSGAKVESVLNSRRASVVESVESSVVAGTESTSAFTPLSPPPVDRPEGVVKVHCGMCCYMNARCIIW